ncbi:protamine-like protein [Pleuronectes platessa]|uniref:protamine-like protein n=1 Tax=Pleuronectes platessa TaxID=8262 RepID=UPI00232A1338|nr:protamine-like protein [Pleuronectes platessa]
MRSSVRLRNLMSQLKSSRRSRYPMGSKSPKRRVMTPKTRAKSPRRTKSPRRSRSPRRSKSSRRSRYPMGSKSPKRRVMTPKTTAKSPRRTKSPMRSRYPMGSKSPKRRVMTPKTTAKSPRRTKSPRRSRTPTRSKSPMRSESPKIRAKSPKMGANRSKSPRLRAKSPTRRVKLQREYSGYTVSNMILEAVSASKERHGISLPALKKALQAGGYDVARNNARVLLTIRRLVASKYLVQKKGPSGSFKVNKKAPAP